MSREIDAIDRLVAERVMGCPMPKTATWEEVGALCGGSDGTDSFGQHWLSPCGLWRTTQNIFGDDPGAPDWCTDKEYSTDPAADCSVLAQVRETWDWAMLTKFSRALEEIWAKRSGGCLSFPWLAIQVGDYSRAALAALGVAP